MAQSQSMDLRALLASALSREVVERLARETGVLRRRRKVEPMAWLWTLVLGFGTGRVRSLAGLRRSYQRASGESLVPSAYYDRFSTATVRFLRAVVRELCAGFVAREGRLGGVLAGFRDVVVADATLIKLHRLLAGRYPGTRTNSAPASAKLHVVMSVGGAGAQSVRLTDGRASDHQVLRIGRWVRDRLLMFDLGFFRYQLFDCIDRNGGFFPTRLPNSANPRIVEVHRVWRGQSIQLVGERLGDVVGRLRRAVLDAAVEVEFQRRGYRGTRRTARRRLRLIGVRHPASGEYRFYLTNITPEQLDAESLAQAYACRWQVELLFRELKSHYRLTELPSRKAHVVETLLLAAVITLLVSRRLLDAVRRRLRQRPHQVPEERWAAVFASFARDLLDLVLLPARRAAPFGRQLSRLLLHEAADPNLSRVLLIERVETGCAWGESCA